MAIFCWCTRVLRVIAPLYLVLAASLPGFFPAQWAPSNAKAQQDQITIKGELLHIEWRQVYTVIASRVNVRDNIGTSANVITQATQGQEFMLATTGPIGQYCEYYCWWPIVLEDGQEAWIADRNGSLGVVDYKAVRIEVLSPSTVASIRRSLPAGETRRRASYITMVDDDIVAVDDTDHAVAFWIWEEIHNPNVPTGSNSGFWLNAICNLDSNTPPKSRLTAQITLHPGQSAISIYDVRGERVGSFQREATQTFTVRGKDPKNREVLGYEDEEGQYRFVLDIFVNASDVQISQLPVYDFQTGSIAPPAAIAHYDQVSTVSDIDEVNSILVIDGQEVPLTPLHQNGRVMRLGLLDVDSSYTTGFGTGVVAVALGWSCETLNLNGMDTDFVSLAVVTRIGNSLVHFKFVQPAHWSRISYRTDRLWNTQPESGALWDSSLVKVGTMIHVEPDEVTGSDKGFHSFDIIPTAENQIVVHQESELLSLTRSPDPSVVYVMELGILTIPATRL